MKLLRNACLVLLSSCLLFLFACNKDDGGDNSDFSFAGQSFKISGGAVLDYGPLLGKETEHYNYDFVVFDGGVDTETATFNGKMFLYAELYSSGDEGFTPGIFEYIEADSPEDIADKNFFEVVDLVVDGNDNGTLVETLSDIQEDELFFATGGTIEVRDNGDNNYTIIYDLTMLDVSSGEESSLEFSVTRGFDYFDEQNINGRIPSGKELFKRVRLSYPFILLT